MQQPATFPPTSFQRQASDSFPHLLPFPTTRVAFYSVKSKSAQSYGMSSQTIPLSFLHFGLTSQLSMQPLVCPGAQVRILILTPYFPDPLSLSLHPLPRARYPDLTCAPVKSLSLHCATGLPCILADALSQGPWRCGPVWGFPRFPCLFVEPCSRFFNNGCALPQKTVFFVQK